MTVYQYVMIGLAAGSLTIAVLSYLLQKKDK